MSRESQQLFIHALQPVERRFTTNGGRGRVYGFLSIHTYKSSMILHRIAFIFEAKQQQRLQTAIVVGAGDSIKFGAPLVEGATVLVKVVSHGRHDKVRIFKMRRRKHYQKRQGHRQNFTEIQIVSING